jgi:dTDP-4-dehydrorhamnose reductase
MDASATAKLVTAIRPTHIIHCAAATNIDWCEEHPAQAEQVNAQASAFLAGLACEFKAQFVYISTDAVFDGKQGNYSESDEPAPLNAYARSKLQGEQEVLRLCPSALVARVNIYGWNGQNKLSLAEWILEQLAAGKQVPGFTDVHFTPMLANDLAEVLLAMLDRKLVGLYHVVGSERVSKFEFARRVAAVFGFDPERVLPTRAAEAGLRAVRPPDISLNSGKVTVDLGRAMPDLDSGLRRFRALRDAGYPLQLKSYLTGASG